MDNWSINLKPTIPTSAGQSVSIRENMVPIRVGFMLNVKCYNYDIEHKGDMIIMIRNERMGAVDRSSPEK